MARWRWLWATGLALLSTGSAVAALQTGKPAPPADADLPAEIARLPFEIRDGYRRFTRRCTTCHDAKRVLSARKSLFDWQGTIGAMAMKKGAEIPLDDRPAIFLYLAYVHGTQGAPEEREQYLTFLAKCEDCHGIGLVYKEKKKLADWPGIIHRMAGKSQARISPEDEKKVLAYIQRMHPDLFGID